MTSHEAEADDPKHLAVAHDGETDADIHQDKGMKILDTYDGDKEWTEEEENRLRRKVDYRLMPILCLTYGLQYYDKAMLGQAVRSSGRNWPFHPRQER